MLVSSDTVPTQVMSMGRILNPSAARVLKDNLGECIPLNPFLAVLHS
jgi:hypothetical protein